MSGDQRVLRLRRMTEEPTSIVKPKSPTDSILRARIHGGSTWPAVNRDNFTDTDTTQQTRKHTQEDQDKSDEEARKKAMKELIQSWMDRLQLISVITTFFAATEAQLIGSTASVTGGNILLAANAGLTGALVVHVYAAILSFFGAFFLVRYRLKEATKDEVKVEINDAEKSGNVQRSASGHLVISTNPHLETVGIFRRGRPPINFLQACHTICMWMAAVGFLLALIGVLCFVWAVFPSSVSGFATGCVGVCTVASVIALVWAMLRDHEWT